MRLASGRKKILAAVAATVLVLVMGSSVSGFAQKFSSSISTDGDNVTMIAGTAGGTSADGPAMTPFRMRDRLPFEAGAIVQGGVGVTEDRDNFRFLMVGLHAGKVLYRRDKAGLFQGDFEYAGELFPYWQSFTPTFQRAKCVAGPAAGQITCSPYYTVGGTFSGITVTPIILRWNFSGLHSGHGKLVPWAQAAGGLLWTNHKYPAFGSPVLNLFNDGPNTDASVWNFTPQGGIGMHYFVSPTRSIDFGANAVHISSASLGDKNPGVNASVQFSIGYTFWK